LGGILCNDDQRKSLIIIGVMLMAWLTYIESAVLVAILVISTTSFRAWRIIRIRQIWIAGLNKVMYIGGNISMEF